MTDSDSSHFRVSRYRPFCKKWLYYDPLLNDRPSSFNKIFPAAITNAENAVIVVSDHGYRTVFSALAVSAIPDLHLLAATDGFQCFPYYTYAEDGSNRRENITNWVLSSLIVTPPWTKRSWALPFLSVLATSAEVDARLGCRHKTVPELAGQMVAVVRSFLPDLPIQLIGNGAYSGLTLG